MHRGWTKWSKPKWSISYRSGWNFSYWDAKRYKKHYWNIPAKISGCTGRISVGKNNYGWYKCLLGFFLSLASVFDFDFLHQPLLLLLLLVSCLRFLTSPLFYFFLSPAQLSTPIKPIIFFSKKILTTCYLLPRYSFYIHKTFFLAFSQNYVRWVSFVYILFTWTSIGDGKINIIFVLYIELEISGCNFFLYI